jgi:hypothetical protein
MALAYAWRRVAQVVDEGHVIGELALIKIWIGGDL